MRKVIILLAIILFVSNCQKAGNMNETITLQEIKQNQGKELTIAGIYKPACLNQKPGRTEYNGHYKIEVSDSLSVLLLPPYNPQSKRAADEVSRFEGKKVKVTGYVTDKTFMEEPTLDNAPLTLSLPCFTEIKKIEIVE